MKNNNLHKLDKIFLTIVLLVGIIAGMTDVFYWKDVEYGGFPVFSCISVFISYLTWIILLIYSNLTIIEKYNKPKFVRWYMYFLLPFLHITFIIVGYLIAFGILNFFK